MKKIYLTLIAVIAVIQFSFAQWNVVSGTNNISNTNTGNVGIGTTTPGATLDVNGAIAVKGIITHDTQNISVPSDGTYVIASGTRIKGTYTFSFEASYRIQTVVLLASGSQYDSGSSSISILSNTSYTGAVTMSNFRFVYNADNSIIFLVFDIGNRNGGTLITAHFDGTGAYSANWGGALPTSPVAAGIYPLVINNGNVLVGQASQKNGAYKLDVYGTARANSIVVNATGADFVFDPSYKLNTLSALEKYIDKNHHLPEIASAKDMQANGVDLGQNQVKLLQKVEELTLYLIEKDKQLKLQQEQIDMQKGRVKSQQAEINKLIQQMAKLSGKSK